LVDAFRYLANTCVTLSHVDALKKSQPGNITTGAGAAAKAEKGTKEAYLKAQLEELRAPLQTHAACAQERLTHDGEWSPSALRGERERSALLLAVSAMRREMQRFDAELQPLINDMEGTDKASKGASAASRGAAGGPGAAAGGAAEEQEQDGGSDKNPCIPCEVCGMLIPVHTFQTHLQKRHGVVYGHLVESLKEGTDPLSRSLGKGEDALMKPQAPGFGGQRDEVLDMPVVMPLDKCPFILPPTGLQYDGKERQSG
jgi:hypothetical protein